MQLSDNITTLIMVDRAYVASLLCLIQLLWKRTFSKTKLSLMDLTNHFQLTGRLYFVIAAQTA